jgi:predicted P-loop ATPase
MAGRFAYDQHQLRSVVADGLRPIENHDVTEIMVLIQHQFLKRVTRAMVVEAIEAAARDHPFHPIRSYLDGLAWDGAARVDSWLATYLRAENTPYTRAVGRWFLLSMVARVIEPGCKADYTLVLEGRQGTRKSTACRILGGAWFSDTLPDLRQWWGPQEYLKGKWLIEIAELSATQKTGSDQLKAFLTPGRDLPAKERRR